MIQRLLQIVSNLLITILWPLRKVVGLLSPPGEYDGLSNAVTEKAAQQFIAHLKSLSSSTEQRELIDQVFSSTGFASVKQQAADTNSVIVIYLHSPLHAKATQMCLRLISPPMLDFLSNRLIKTLAVSIHTSQGTQLAQTLEVASFPVLAVLQKPPNSRTGPLQLVFKAEGPNYLKTSVSRLIPILNGTLRNHETVVAAGEARRLQLEQANELRRQQDEEFQESLRADRERERARVEALQKEEEQRLQKQRDDEEEARKEQERLDNAKQIVRPAPESGGTRVRFTLPTGKKLDRRFHNDDTIAVLKAFLQVHFTENNIEIKNIGLSSTFPRKEYTDGDVTLVDGGLSPQAVLMVQDLDA